MWVMVRSCVVEMGVDSDEFCYVFGFLLWRWVSVGESGVAGFLL